MLSNELSLSFPFTSSFFIAKAPSLKLISLLIQVNVRTPNFVIPFATSSLFLTFSEELFNLLGGVLAALHRYLDHRKFFEASFPDSFDALVSTNQIRIILSNKIFVFIESCKIASALITQDFFMVLFTHFDAEDLRVTNFIPCLQYFLQCWTLDLCFICRMLIWSNYHFYN